MSRYSASAYWREVRKEAFQKSDPVDWIQWVLPPVVTSAAAWSLGVGEAMSEIAKVMIALGSGLLVFALVGGIKVARSAFRLHLSGLTTIGRIEKERNEAVRQVAAVRAAIVAEAESADKTIIAVLLKQIDYGTHFVANKLSPGLRHDEQQQWKAARTKWEHETKAEMERVGCNATEVISFWDYTPADLSAIGTVFPNRDQKTNQRAQAVHFRLRALKRIVNNRSHKPVFPDA
jgi:hypothetical protein